ncbi:MAG: hypothetical protein ACLGIR_03530 [Actinomycetes bacterium]
MRTIRRGRGYGLALLVVVLLSGCSRPDPVQQAFADAIAAGDLEAAWAVLEPPVIYDQPWPGRADALTMEHFVAAFEGVVLTGELESFGRPVLRWPDGTEDDLSLPGAVGSARFVLDVLSVTVNGTDAPVRVWLDGVEVPGARFEEGTAAGWLHLSLWMFPGGARTVEVEFVSGKRLEVAVPHEARNVFLVGDTGAVEVYDRIPAPSDRRPTFVTPQGP